MSRQAGEQISKCPLSGSWLPGRQVVMELRKELHKELDLDSACCHGMPAGVLHSGINACIVFARPSSA